MINGFSDSEETMYRNRFRENIMLSGHVKLEQKFGAGTKLKMLEVCACSDF